MLGQPVVVRIGLGLPRRDECGVERDPAVEQRTGHADEASGIVHDVVRPAERASHVRQLVRAMARQHDERVGHARRGRDEVAVQAGTDERIGGGDRDDELESGGVRPHRNRPGPGDLGDPRQSRGIPVAHAERHERDVQVLALGEELTQASAQRVILGGRGERHLEAKHGTVGRECAARPQLGEGQAPLVRREQAGGQDRRIRHDRDVDVRVERVQEGLGGRVPYRHVRRPLQQRPHDRRLCGGEGPGNPAPVPEHRGRRDPGREAAEELVVPVPPGPAGQHVGGHGRLEPHDVATTEHDRRPGPTVRIGRRCRIGGHHHAVDAEGCGPTAGRDPRGRKTVGVGRAEPRPELALDHEREEQVAEVGDVERAPQLDRTNVVRVHPARPAHPGPPINAGRRSRRQARASAWSMSVIDRMEVASWR